MGKLDKLTAGIPLKAACIGIMFIASSPLIFMSVYGRQEGKKDGRNQLYQQVSTIADTNNDGKLDSQERASVYEVIGIDYVPYLDRLTNNQMKTYLEKQKNQ